MPALLGVEGLSVAYGRSVALREVDVAVPEGVVVGVLGANGAGKSTLLRAIAGLVRPAAGQITLEGRRIDGRPAHGIARLGVRLVPEGRGILPSLSVAENLRVILEPEARQAAYDRFGVLADRRDQPAGTLSGGEQQMLALARAFDPGVRLLLVDEPSLGLAPRLVDMVEDTLRRLHADRGVGILWVEQYVSRVLALADVVYILGRGRVAWVGEPGELKRSRVLAKTYLGGSAV